MSPINHAYKILMNKETGNTYYAVKTHWDNWCIWEPIFHNGWSVKEIKSKFTILDSGFSSEHILTWRVK